MEIAEERVGEALSVALIGRLDALTSKAVEQQILKRIDEGQRRLVIDLERLDYISSVGLRVLLLTAKRLKSGNGTVVVCSLQPSIRQVFDIAGFTALFQIVGTRAEALQQIQGV
jgi:stage II sporulation protein AA (anti-sigma F factor antagonist)